MCPSTEPAPPGHYHAEACFSAQLKLRPLDVTQLLAGIGRYEELVEFDDDPRERETVRPPWHIECAFETQDTELATMREAM